MPTKKILLILGLFLCLTGNAWGQKKVKATVNTPPTVKLSSTVKDVTVLPASCQGMVVRNGCEATNPQINLSTAANDLEGDALTYSYTTTGGRVEGSGTTAVWDVSGLRPGVYRANVFARDTANHEVCDWVTVNVTECQCDAPTPPAPKRPCADISINGPAEVVQAGDNMTVTATVRGADAPVSYNWLVSSGTIIRGQGSPSITIDRSGLDGRGVTATVEVGGLPPDCPTNKSISFIPGAPPLPIKVDDFGITNIDADKARLDAFGTRIQQEPSSQGYIIAYGSCQGDGVMRALRFQDYLVNNRGLDKSRLVIVDGGCRDAMAFEFYLVPQGAAPPSASNAGPCMPCKRGKRR